MIATYGSWLLMAWGLAAFWLTGHKRRVGWLLAAASEPVWIWYAIVLRQWGLIPGSLVYGAIFLVNWWRWRRMERAS